LPELQAVKVTRTVITNPQTNKAVMDRRLRPWYATCSVELLCTSISCRYMRTDIMCKHDIMNIQHAHCGLVGPDRAVSVSALACNGYSYAPFIAKSKGCASVSWAATLSCLGFCASMTSFIKARTQAGEDRTCISGDMLAQTSTDRHGHHNTPLSYRCRSKKTSSRASRCVY